MFPIASSADSERPRLLVTCAEACSSSELAAALREASFELVAAESWAAAQEMVGTVKPQLILVDITANDIRSKELDLLRTRTPRSTPPVIGLARPGEVDNIRRAYEAGVDDVIERPNDPVLFARRLWFALRQAKHRAVLEARDQRLQRAQRMARLASWEWSLETDEFHIDHEPVGLRGCPKDDREGFNLWMLDRIDRRDRGRFLQTMEARRPHRLEYRITIDPGFPARIFQQEAELAQDTANGEVRLVGTLQDITALRNAEKRASRLAYFDTLTGLPNRTFLQEHLPRVLAEAKRFGTRVAVLEIDLDLFKRINDTMGHDAGDALLREVAQRARAAVRETDLMSISFTNLHTSELTLERGEPNTVMRMGGDEFVVVLTHLTEPEDAAIVARRIRDALAVGVHLRGKEVFVGCSIGIALYPENGSTPEALLKNADAAMYGAKEQGRNNYQFFSDSMNQRAQRRLELEMGLRRALANRELQVFYQPKISLKDGGRVVGVEALVRWILPDGKHVSPAEFIPVAEETGLILPLGEFVLREACRRGREWLDAVGGDGLSIAVNVSGRQFREQNVPALVKRTLDETGLPPELLELEITEGIIMHDTMHGVAVVDRIKELGVRVGLDDFGTGYSSLSYLTRFPVDTLKIDQSFVRALGKDGTAEAITSAIIALARTLKLEVVAEGVETREQAAFLAAHGIDVCQGYLFGRPVPADQILGFVHANG